VVVDVEVGEVEEGRVRKSYENGNANIVPKHSNELHTNQASKAHTYSGFTGFRHMHFLASALDFLGNATPQPGPDATHSCRCCVDRIFIVVEQIMHCKKATVYAKYM